MSHRPFNVLFLCTGNSARSILAEVILNKVGAGKFNAYSAGSHPNGKVNSYALDLLQRLGFETAHLRSKPWDEFSAPDAPELDFVITVCDNAAGEVCPIWPGQPMTAHWGLPDPAAVEGSLDQQRQAFLDTFVALKRRIELMLALPLASLDKMALRHELKGIGQR